MLHALEDRGGIVILAIGVVTGHEATVPYGHAVSTWYGKPELPVRTIKEKAPYARDEYMVPVVAAYPHKLSREEVPDVVNLYPKVLVIPFYAFIAFILFVSMVILFSGDPEYGRTIDNKRINDWAVEN